MFPTWRMRLREARVACRSGHYDEASELLTSEPLREFLPAKRLAQDVAGKILERAGADFSRGDSAKGWSDLATAERLGGQGDAIRQLQRQYAQQGLSDARRYLAAGRPEMALARLDKLQRRHLVDGATLACQELAVGMRAALAAAARGQFPAAAAAIESVAGLAHADMTGSCTMEIAQRLNDLSQRFADQGAECQRLSAAMHAALTREDWGQALSAADALLAIAPQHAAAVQVRRRAWQAVGMDVTRAPGPRRSADPVSLAIARAGAGRRTTHHAARSGEADTVSGNEPPQRALLWIDAVGGFLVCLDNRVVLGQPSPSDSVAVPILADLSRRHAVIRRDAGAYVVEPVHSTLVDGREASGPVVLADNQLIQLGHGVRLRFNRPHALSATAKLVVESNHKTQPSVDAVLLMADSCVLGPNRHCHVQCRDWQHDVVLYRQADRVYCRADRPLALDGAVCNGAGELHSGVRVEGEDFSFAWERLDLQT